MHDNQPDSVLPLSFDNGTRGATPSAKPKPESSAGAACPYELDGSHRGGGDDDPGGEGFAGGRDAFWQDEADSQGMS